MSCQSLGASAKTELCSRRTADSYISGTPIAPLSSTEKVFPDEELKCRSRSINVAGLQIADLVASGQKLQILRSNVMPLSAEPSEFTLQVDDAIAHLVNRYGAVFVP